MIEAGLLNEIAGIAHGFFTREGGASTGLFSSLNCGFGSGDELETVARNRALVADAIGVEPERLLTLYQEHSPKVITVSQPWRRESAPLADAMVTREPGIALGALTADCAPVIFADSARQIVGIAHAGWKGALSGVTDATVSAMEDLGADRASIVAAIGPAISSAAYEVGPEFYRRFLEADAANEAFFRPAPKPQHWLFDLPGYLVERLRRNGIGAAHDLALCTYHDERRFFSYRRATHRNQSHYGRLISAIAITR
jgi:purine-nucleoside/S-methyl-5'-thioadenosine phosphorylase / adenosine deaminase